MIKLRPNQEAAVDFIYAHDHSLVLAPVGAGKTAIAQTSIKEFLQTGIAKRFLVLAPKRVCTDVWSQEAVKWMPNVGIAVAVGSPGERLAAFVSGAQVVVMNYENIAWLCDDNPQLLKGFDGVVYDELTKLKNPSGKRFKSWFKRLPQFKITVGLTGSFTSNGLEDCFGQCKVVDQKLLGRAKGAFLQQYFHCIDREKSIYEPRESALKLVMERIRPAVFMIDNQTYKNTLPPLNIIEMYCDMADRKPYEKMKKDLAYEFPTAKIIAQNTAVVSNKLRQLASGFIYETTKTPNPNSPGKFITTQKTIWVSDHKFNLLAEIVEENQNAPTIIVYNFQEELAELLRRYPSAETIDRLNIVPRWNKGEVPMLLIHPKSAGHGLNLQFGGSKMIFVSQPWSQEEYEQTIGRLHRSGQEHAVYVYLLQTRNSIDMRVLASLGDKKELSNLALQELQTVKEIV